MIIVVEALILAICAVLVCVNPNLINISEAERKRMDPKKTSRYAFLGLMATALVLAMLYLLGIRNELVPMFVGIPGAILTAALIQCSIPNK